MQPPEISALLAAGAFGLRNLSVLAALLVLYSLRPQWLESFCGRIAESFQPLLARTWLATLIAAAFPLLIRLALLPVVPIPVPFLHDEFSNLLAADTFAHARLTNPPHPLWEFFETFHVLQQPTYMSMYPPAAGAVLFIGQVLFGHPWWGAFLMTGVMCGTAFWAMKPWLGDSWAFASTLMMGLLYGTGHYWMDGYWVASATATGGALLFGAYGRLRSTQKISWRSAIHGILLALGAAILANSRPWEGFVYSVPFATAFLVWIARHRAGTVRDRIRLAAAPAVAILALAAAFLAYYCWRGTGDALRMPYLVNRKTYAIARLFVWQPPRPAPEYRNEPMREFYVEWEPGFQEAHRPLSFASFYASARRKLKLVEQLWGGRFFSLLILVSIIPLWRRAEWRFPLAVLAVFSLGLMLQRYCQTHYLAPIACLAIAFAAAALRGLHGWRHRGRNWGLALSLTIILCATANAVENNEIMQRFKKGDPLGQKMTGIGARASIVDRLKRSPGKDLVMVHYRPGHNPHGEWVYNNADIDGSEIVWAREMSPEQNRRLLEYFRGRKFWVLDADIEPPELRHLGP